jgi:copper(I)-binding protein
VTGATITPTGEGTATITFGAHNAGTDTDQLLGVTCDCGGSARVLGPDGDDVDGVDIAPEETLFLGPGTATVEIRGIPAPLEPGSFVGLTVEFANAGEVVTDAEVAPEI